MTATTARARAIAADPEFQSAVIGAMRGNLAGLVAMDDEHLQVAARSLSILVAGHVVRDQPCTLAGFRFWSEAGEMTFCPAEAATPADPVHVTAARMVTVDAAGLLTRDHGEATHEMWHALMAAVPLARRRQLALLLAGKFTSAPEIATPGRAS